MTFIDLAKVLGVIPGDVDVCMTWAFGDNWNALRVLGNYNVWNERHGDIFVICNTDSVEESYRRIGAEWRGIHGRN